MSPENPVLLLTIALAIFGPVVAELATSIPSPGEPIFPTTMMGVGAIAGAGWHYLRRRSRDGMQDRAFIWSMVAGGLGLATYLTLLAIHLF